MLLYKNRNSTFKPIYLLLRFILNVIIYQNLFTDPGFTDELCGPLAIPMQQDLFYHIVCM